MKEQVCSGKPIFRAINLDHDALEHSEQPRLILKAFKVVGPSMISDDFTRELEANMRLPNTSMGGPSVVKLVDYGLATKEMPLLSFKLGDTTLEISTYCFIILPFYKDGTLLSLLVKAIETGVTISEETQQYLAK